MQSLKKIHAWAQMKVPLSMSLRNGIIFWNDHGIMNTSGLLQSK